MRSRESCKRWDSRPSGTKRGLPNFYTLHLPWSPVRSPECVQHAAEEVSRTEGNGSYHRTCRKRRPIRDRTIGRLKVRRSDILTFVPAAKGSTLAGLPEMKFMLDPCRMCFVADSDPHFCCTLCWSESYCSQRCKQAHFVFHNLECSRIITRLEVLSENVHSRRRLRK